MTEFKCGHPRNESNTYRNGLSVYCRTCNRDGAKKWREEHPEQVRVAKRVNSAKRYVERRGWIDAIKLETGCVDCGYNAHPAALQFDHVDPGTKLFRIATSLTKSKESILAEVAKCVVRCANCHAVRTTIEHHTTPWHIPNS